MSEVVSLIEISRGPIHNANAVSGPLSWGFPAPSAFTGFVHALQRKLDGVKLGGVGIICHHFNPQEVEPPNSYAHSFSLMRHPYQAAWRQKNFQPNKGSAIVEEGRAHLGVTLLIELLEDEPRTEDERRSLSSEIQTLVSGMRIAGGALHHPPTVWVHDWPETGDEARKEFHRRRYRWLPGYALVERCDLLYEHLAVLRQKAPGTDALEAMLDLLALHIESKLTSESDDKFGSSAQTTEKKTDSVEWISKKRRSSWLVPIPIGYRALSELHEPGSVPNTRDMTVPFRFVESLYSIGQWLSPHRLTSLEHLLWRTEFHPKRGLYLCRNKYSKKEQPHG